MRVYVTWKEFDTIVSRSDQWYVTRLWDRVFHDELLTRIKQAESSKQTIELIPTVELPPFRVEE